MPSKLKKPESGLSLPLKKTDIDNSNTHNRLKFEKTSKVGFLGLALPAPKTNTNTQELKIANYLMPENSANWGRRFALFLLIFGLVLFAYGLYNYQFNQKINQTTQLPIMQAVSSSSSISMQGNVSLESQSSNQSSNINTNSQSNSQSLASEIINPSDVVQINNNRGNPDDQKAFDF